MATIGISRGRSLAAKHIQRALFFRLFSNGSTSSVENDTIGFVGLGNMGGPMAKNLMDAGHKIVVNDIYPEAMDDLKQLGAATATSPREIASKATRIITMLPSSPNVREVFLGENGLLKTLQPGTLLIDSSTIEPVVAKEMAEITQGKGAHFFDAPVSGGVGAAKSGTLTFMVGGNEDHFEAAKEILQHMGKNIVHTGAVGTGQAAKVCNNMVLAVSMIGVAEGMNLGMRLGLDAEMLAKVINSSTGRCWASDTYNPVPGVIEGVPSSNNYQGGFMAELMTKDLGLAQSASTLTKSPTPMGSLAHQIYRIMCNKGFGKLDFSSVYKFLKEDQR